METMTQSPEIGALVEALAAAQGEIQGAKKDSENPHLKSKYADLASIVDACKQPLSKNKLAYIQTMEPGTDGNVIIITTLAHSSGQWIRGKLAMKPVKPDPQGVGSAITYARRYALAAIVGIAPEDDDGNAASMAGTSSNNGRVAMATAHQIAAMQKILADIPEEIQARFTAKYGHPGNIAAHDVDSLIARLNAAKQKASAAVNAQNGAGHANHH